MGFSGTNIADTDPTHKNKGTNEAYTHVSTKSLRKIESPLDTIKLDKGGE